jgi:DNA-binding IclR family transcriptional regulator
VRNVAGQVIAAINIFGPTFRFPAAGRQAEITQWAIACAQQMGMQQRRN